MVKFEDLFNRPTIIKATGLLDTVSIPPIYIPNYTDVSSITLLSAMINK